LIPVVSIAEPESLPPSLYTPSEDSTRIKQYKAGVADKRMTGRPMMPSNSSSRLSILSQSSIDEPAPASDASVTSKQGDGKHHGHHHHHHHRYKNEEQAQQQHDKLLTQVAQWLQAEKAKRAAKNAKRGSEYDLAHDSDRSATSTRSKPRTSSQSSDSSAISLEKLQRILEDNISSFEHEKILASSPVLGPRRPSHIHGRRRSSARYVSKLKSSARLFLKFSGYVVYVTDCCIWNDN
jgi:choline kinase